MLSGCFEKNLKETWISIYSR